MDKKRPGAEISNRPLHFFWILDCSGSMGADGKIQQLNTAIREAIPALKDVARENPEAQVLMRSVKFSDGASWHDGDPTLVDDFKWTDLKANGLTDMGKALSLVADQLKIPPMNERALPPVLVLVSDGQPTDDFKKGLSKLTATPWGKKSVRMAIAIGGDADLDVLKKFIGNNEYQPLQANNPDQLAMHIKWASTVALQNASDPVKNKKVKHNGGGFAPPPPDVDDVW